MWSVLRIFFRARGTNPWVVLGCLIVASICEGIGLASLVPLLAAASGSAKKTLISDSVHGSLAALGLDASLGTLIVVLVLGFLLKSLISMAVMRKIGYANAEVANSMRVQLVRQMLARSCASSSSPAPAAARHSATPRAEPGGSAAPAERERTPTVRGRPAASCVTGGTRNGMAVSRGGAACAIARSPDWSAART